MDRVPLAMDDFDDERVIQVVSVVVFLMAVLGSMFGPARLYELINPTFDLLSWREAIAILAGRPIPIDLFQLIPCTFVWPFLLWQLCFHRHHYGTLARAGGIAAAIILLHAWLNAWLAYWFVEEHDGQYAVGAPKVVADIVLTLLESWLLASLSATWLGGTFRSWSRIRLAALAWANGAAFLLLGQVFVIALVRGAGTFSF